MTARSTAALPLAALAGAAFYIQVAAPPRELPPRAAVDNDWFMLQRAFPRNDVPEGAFARAAAELRSLPAPAGPRSAAAWASAGPTNIGGRVTALAIHPTTPATVYATAAAGGVWKTTDAGATWTKVFSTTLSIGSLILHPSDPSTVLVGTGEANPGGVAIYPGDGLWRSTDAGGTWARIGLEQSGHIGRLAVHPSAPARYFAAALGRYRSRTQERGIYRTTDAGSTWQRVLFLNDTTGAADVIVDPGNPNRVIAAMWTRHRPITYSIIGGGSSALYLSNDAGATWAMITAGFPSQQPTLGRVSLNAARSNPAVVYALASNGTGVNGVYKSTDGGAGWTQVATGSAFSGEGQVWYNNVITVHPSNPDIVIAGMTDIYRSTSGGSTWSRIGTGIHVDHHAVEFDPLNPNRVISGNDGGVYTSTNLGTSWTQAPNLPISQFYAGTIDYTNPSRIYGGMQDNGTARTLTGALNDWQEIYGGDGFTVLVDPTNPNRIYAEYQNGGLAFSTNGGGSFQSGTSGISGTDRKNWHTPFVMDPSVPLTLYTGTQRVYRTTNGMAGWTAISGDLTRGANGRIGTLTTLAVARTDGQVIYTGADDGRVNVTTNGGASWTDISAGLPVRWVTRVTVDPDSANVAYVTLSGYLEDRFQAHIYRTADYGTTWVPLGGGLPDIPLNDVIVDPVARPFLYVATDAGVIYSSDGGGSWSMLGTGLPSVPVHDLTLHPPTRKLLASTHGRSQFLFDVGTVTGASAPRDGAPAAFTLAQNFPNPFNGGTVIPFSLEGAGAGGAQRVRLAVYDLLGREVAVLLDAAVGPGAHTARWDGRDADGRPAATGAYLYRLETGSEASRAALSRILVLLR